MPFSCCHIADKPDFPHIYALQYEVNRTAGHTCGGSYIKLLTHSPDYDPAVGVTEANSYSSECEWGLVYSGSGHDSEMGHARGWDVATIYHAVGA